MIARCYRCWGSKNLEDMFTCSSCQHVLCKTHKGLPGLLLCIECFESDVTGGEEKDDKSRKSID